MAGVAGSTGVRMMVRTGFWSCGLPSGWRAGSRNLAPPERLDDAHRTTTLWAWFSHCQWDDLGTGRVFLRGRLCAEQLADPLDVGFALRGSEEAVVADAMEPIRENVDQVSADELICRKPHDLHPISPLYPIVFPAECHGARIGADEAAV